MNTGFTDWNQEVGISQPETIRSTLLLVYRFIRPPACSKAAQKKMEKSTKTPITSIRSTSMRLTGSAAALG